MERPETINKIHETFQTIRNASFHEKREGINAEEQINKFLDRIIDLQELLNEKSTEIENINQSLESLTWLNSLDENYLKELNDLIASARDLYSILLRQYVTLNHFGGKEIAEDASIRFKSAIGDLKEITADIESIFFFLPQMPDFIETTRELSL